MAPGRLGQDFRKMSGEGVRPHLRATADMGPELLVWDDRMEDRGEGGAYVEPRCAPRIASWLEGIGGSAPEMRLSRWIDVCRAARMVALYVAWAKGAGERFDVVVCDPAGDGRRADGFSIAGFVRAAGDDPWLDRHASSTCDVEFAGYGAAVAGVRRSDVARLGPADAVACAVTMGACCVSHVLAPDFGPREVRLGLSPDGLLCVRADDVADYGVVCERAQARSGRETS